MNKLDLLICSDFDGTFTAKDIGNRIFTHFSDGRNLELVQNWKKRLISSRECLRGEAALINTTPEQLFSFLETFSLASGALEFHAAISRLNIPFFILSDGLDIYIENILKRYGLDEIRYFSNRGIIKNGQLIIDFPFDNDGCPRCGCCKGARIREIRREFPGRKVVFIGDGLSDICALPESDIVFARGDLLNYCRLNNSTAIEYENFYDILKWLNNSGYMAGESH
jgi:2-hydroxy-3-keto-5-methylthiopentenyl-1-phosphate phosphatase